MPTVLKDTFSAWIDKMPVNKPKLIVIGDVEVNTGGWKGAFVRAVPQGINPNILILDIRMTPPTGDVIQVVSIVKLRFEEQPPQHPYTDVTIRDGTDEFTIPVKETH